MAAISGNPKFFLGTVACTPSKPGSRLRLRRLLHRQAAIQLYAKPLKGGALDKLEGFASFHGPDRRRCLMPIR